MMPRNRELPPATFPSVIVPIELQAVTEGILMIFLNILPYSEILGQRPCACQIGEFN